jgi:hypothetical protein
MACGSQPRLGQRPLGRVLTKSRLVTAKCQRPLWSTLRTQVGYIPRSEKCQNRIRAPQLSITLSGRGRSFEIQCLLPRLCEMGGKNE